MPSNTLRDSLRDQSRPVFLFGSTPPREGTTIEKAKDACSKFAARSAVLATDGYIVYDIQDEGARTQTTRPFPFRKTIDPSLYASFFPTVAGKGCIVYKSVGEETAESFDVWMDRAQREYNQSCFNLVGAPSSRDAARPSLSLQNAGLRAAKRSDAAFGCVCIPERHITKGNEDVTMAGKVAFGAEWFVTQGIFASTPIIKLIHDYGDKCKRQGIVPKKLILTFAPCGREKTMIFIKWLGMHVPEDIEKRILQAANPVSESVTILGEILRYVLEQTGGSGVPIGVNVESLSIFKEEINAAHELFQLLQVTLLNSRGSPWAVKWFFIPELSDTSSTPAYHNGALSVVAPVSKGYELASSASDIAKRSTAAGSSNVIAISGSVTVAGIVIVAVAFGVVIGRSLVKPKLP